MEAAVGAAVHAELCRVFDEVSKVNSLLAGAHVVLPTDELARSDSK